MSIGMNRYAYRESSLFRLSLRQPTWGWLFTLSPMDHPSNALWLLQRNT